MIRFHALPWAFALVFIAHPERLHRTRIRTLRSKTESRARRNDTRAPQEAMPPSASGGTKGYPSTPHLPFSPGVQAADDTKLDDCPWLVGREVVVTEKLDGGNCCLWRGCVYARTHSHEATHPWFASIKALYTSFAASVDDDLMLFGENMSAGRMINEPWIASAAHAATFRSSSPPARAGPPSRLDAGREVAAAPWCPAVAESPLCPCRRRALGRVRRPRRPLLSLRRAPREQRRMARLGRGRRTRARARAATRSRVVARHPHRPHTAQDPTPPCGRTVQVPVARS